MPERQRAERMLDADAGRRWAASRWALRGVLGRYLEIEPAAIELALGEHGKPRLADGSERFAFNLSHSGELALVAVSGGRQVGVDLERTGAERDFIALAERKLGDDAVAALRAAVPEGRAAIFYAAWVQHEARLKCAGGGLGSPAEGEFASAPLDAGDGYAAAVAVADERLPSRRQYSIAPS